MQYANYYENEEENIAYKTNAAFLGDYYVFNSIRYAQGAEDLIPEESTNTSLGFVYQPLDNLTITYDIWSIEKKILLVYLEGLTKVFMTYF